MKITEIEYSNDKKKVTITTNEDYSFVITDDTSLEYPMDVGMEISEEKITEIIYHDMVYKAKNSALKLVSRRLRSEKEIRDFIRGKGYDSIVQDEVIEYLREYNYVDDEEFAKSFAGDKADLKKFGRERITYELKLKGISEENISKAIAPLLKDELSNAVNLLKGKYKKSDLKDIKEKKRMTNFLQRKGYSFEIIYKALRVFEDE